MSITRVAGVATGLSLGAWIVAAIVSGPENGTERTTVPAGTAFVAALEQDLSTALTEPGDEFELRTVRPVHLHGGMEIPAGSLITGEVTDAPGLGVRFTELVFDPDSTEVEIETELYRFGTLVPAASDHVVIPAGQRLTIRLSRPVTVAYRPAPEPMRAAE
jgi:hypothetical protein